MRARGLTGFLYVNTYLEWRGSYRTSRRYNIGEEIEIYTAQPYDDEHDKEQDREATYQTWTIYIRPRLKQTTTTL